MTDIHSCSYFCTRPECIKAQRDELRAENAALKAELAAKWQPIETAPASSDPVLAFSDSGRVNDLGKIAINPEEWPSLKRAIDTMIAECRDSKINC